MRRRRGVDILLRDLVREAIGLEGMLWEWGVLDEDPAVMMENPYSREVDRVVRTDIEPNISSLKLKAMTRPSAAKAEIDTALEQAEGDYDEAVDYLNREPGEDQISPRTLRRLDYQLKGGAKNALKYKDEFAADLSSEEREEKKKKMKGLKKAHRGAKASEKY